MTQAELARESAVSMSMVRKIEDCLARVEHEMYPNEGGSLRDAVDLANRRLARLFPDGDDGEQAPPPRPAPPGAHRPGV